MPHRKLTKEKLIKTSAKACEFRGVPENPSRSKAENLVPTKAEMNDILDTIQVKTRIVELKRLRKFDAEPKKPQTLLVTLPNEHEARLTLAKKVRNMGNCWNKKECSYYLLLKEDALKENLILKKKRELLDEKVFAEKLKMGNWKCSMKDQEWKSRRK